MLQLEYVNDCRAAIGLPPVSALSSSDGATAIALQFLERQRKRILGSGWGFNSETYTLTADSEGLMAVDSSFLSIILPDGFDVVGGYVRDLATHTTTLTPGQTLEGEVILDVPFEDLPELVAQAIADAAKVHFVVMQRGAHPTLPLWRDEARRSMAAARNADPEILTFETGRRRRGRTLQNDEDDDL